MVRLVLGFKISVPGHVDLVHVPLQ